MSMVWPIKVVGVLGANTPSNLSAPLQLKMPKPRIDIAQKLKVLPYARIHCYKRTLYSKYVLHVRDSRIVSMLLPP
jgi:hypothetical protein